MQILFCAGAAGSPAKFALLLAERCIARHSIYWRILHPCREFNDQTLSIVCHATDGLDAWRARFGREATRTLLQHAYDRINGALRNDDVVVHTSDHQFYALVVVNDLCDLAATLPSETVCKRQLTRVPNRRAITLFQPVRGHRGQSALSTSYSQKIGPQRK